MALDYDTKKFFIAAQKIMGNKFNSLQLKFTPEQLACPIASIYASLKVFINAYKYDNSIEDKRIIVDFLKELPHLSEEEFKKAVERELFKPNYQEFSKFYYSQKGKKMIVELALSRNDGWVEKPDENYMEEYVTYFKEVAQKTFPMLIKKVVKEFSEASIHKQSSSFSSTVFKKRPSSSRPDTLNEQEPPAKKPRLPIDSSPSSKNGI